MENTKEKILRCALRLFAGEGFAAVSMRDIARQLQISQSALYKHYAGKQGIFDSIVARMREEDQRRAHEHQLPEQLLGVDDAPYCRTRLEQLSRFTLAQFRYWTEDEFAADFRRLLTLEQYRGPEQSRLYQQTLAGGVLSYVEDLFASMGELHGQSVAPRQLALAFWSPLYLLMNLYDAAEDKAAVTAQAQQHISAFIAALPSGSENKNSKITEKRGK